jgi:hypothetical protein
MHNDESGRDLKAITIRLDMADYVLLKEHAESRNASLNTVVAEAVARYGAELKREQAIASILAFQDRLRSRGPIGTDSVDSLREIRESREAGLVPETTAPMGPEESPPRKPTGGRAT